MFKLVRESTPPELAAADRHHWPVRITATNTSDDSAAKIFVMQIGAPGVFSSDVFSCVASVQQMDDLPVDEADSTSPYYRVSTITVYARTAEAAVEFYLKVEDAVQDLANNIASAETLSVESEVIITPHTP